MRPLSIKQKKITSLSFTQPSIIKNDQKNHYRQFRSHEHKSKNDQQKSMKQKASLTKMFTSIVDQQNLLNTKKHKPFQWQLVIIDQKRTMTGIKVRVRCKHIPTELYIVIRISFTIEYFTKGGIIQENNVFTELDEVNFDMNKNQKRLFQAEIEKVMKPMLNRIIYPEDQDENKWVDELFSGVQNTFIANQYEKKPKKNAQSLNRKQILTKYILYHPPVAFSWSPRGYFCLTENKVPPNKASFIGNIQSFQMNIQGPKVSQMNTVNQQQLSESNQDNQISIFNWDVSQQIQLFSLHKGIKQISPYIKDSTRSTRQIQSKKRNNINNILSNSNKDSIASSTKMDTVILQYASKLTPTIRKIYERHFAIRNDFQYEMIRGEKLNVYSVLSQNRRYEDEMMFLMEKINIEKYKNIIEIVLSNMFSTYPTFFSISSGTSCYSQLDSTKYFVISQFFKEQRLKMSGCPFNLLLCLKSIIVENEFHAQQLQSYFKQCFKMLKVYNSSSKYKIHCLGSYLHFDEYKAQKILMKLLQEYEYHYQLNLKNQKQIRLVVQSKFHQRIKKQIKLKKIFKFPPLNEDWLISDDNRKQLVEIILPILLVRDRNYEQFYYRQLERILTTNQKIIKFFRNLAQVIKKVEQQRHDFIKHLINQYTQYEEELVKLNDDSSSSDVRREFIVYCQKCQRPNRTFQIAQAEKLKICTKCSQSNNAHKK